MALRWWFFSRFYWGTSEKLPRSMFHLAQIHQEWGGEGEPVACISPSSRRRHLGWAGDSERVPGLGPARGAGPGVPGGLRPLCRSPCSRCAAGPLRRCPAPRASAAPAWGADQRGPAPEAPPRLPLRSHLCAARAGRGGPAPGSSSRCLRVGGAGERLRQRGGTRRRHSPGREAAVPAGAGPRVARPGGSASRRGGAHGHGQAQQADGAGRGEVQVGAGPLPLSCGKALRRWDEPLPAAQCGGTGRRRGTRKLAGILE